VEDVQGEKQGENKKRKTSANLYLSKNKIIDYQYPFLFGSLETFRYECELFLLC